jgi:hypothetical protein
MLCVRLSGSIAFVEFSKTVAGFAGDVAPVSDSAGMPNA